MRALLVAAVGLAAGLAHTAQATPKIRTLYVPPPGKIAAFAQDGPLIAWFRDPAGNILSVLEEG